MLGTPNIGYRFIENGDGNALTMYLCACNAVTDRTIRASIAAGARTIDDIARLCGAGASCGGCWSALDELLRERDSSHSPSDRSRAHTAA